MKDIKAVLCKVKQPKKDNESSEKEKDDESKEKKTSSVAYWMKNAKKGK